MPQPPADDYREGQPPVHPPESHGLRLAVHRLGNVAGGDEGRVVGAVGEHHLPPCTLVLLDCP